MRSVGPGPPPTRSTRPDTVARRRRSGRRPSRSRTAMASRRRPARRGSTPASETTPTTTSPDRVSAASRAEPWAPSEALTQRIRRCSHAAAMSASARLSPVAVWTSHAPSTSSGVAVRGIQSIPCRRTSSAIPSESSGATIRTRAPSSRNRCRRRAATGPAPTMRTSRPASETPSMVVMSGRPA